MRRTAIFTTAILLAVALSLAIIPTVQADDETGQISGFAFVPSMFTVQVGDTITLTNNDGNTHTFSADNGSWDSGFIAGGSSGSVTFTQAGDFGFHCNIHSSMKGRVVVQAAQATATSVPTSTATLPPTATATPTPTATQTFTPTPSPTPPLPPTPTQAGSQATAEPSPTEDPSPDGTDTPSPLGRDGTPSVTSTATPPDRTPSQTPQAETARPTTEGTSVALGNDDGGNGGPNPLLIVLGVVAIAVVGGAGLWWFVTR